jgi:phenylpyruvate tautomerase PptA (4-oxalocrotonate tautomerase family)
MPYLHLDLNKKYPTEVKQALAGHLSELFSSIMHSDPRRMTVTFRELGEGNVWRCGTNPPHPGALLTCEIRRGRDTATREQLSKALIAAINERLGLAENELNIEYTQHSGDEMYHPWMHGFSKDWDKDE